MNLARVQYRLQQFWRGFQATRTELTDVEQKKAAGILSPAALLLFQRMPIDGQRHSMNVLTTLKERGDVPHSLAAAALLHDVGKVAAAEAGVAITLWWRGPLVLLETFAPVLLQRYASSDPQTRWRYLLHVHLEHPAIGADWAKHAGCDELTCWLIRCHQDEVNANVIHDQRFQLLTRLQNADGAN